MFKSKTIKEAPKVELNKIQTLRAEYKKLTGNQPFNGWKEDKLKSLIELAKNPEVDPEEKARIEEARRINSQSFNTIPFNKIPPVFKDGEPFAIIDNKYVPWSDAQIIVKEKEIESIQQEIKDIKSGKITF